MGEPRVFLSMVSTEFRSCRESISKYLERGQVDVSTQEKWGTLGFTTLDKLDSHLQKCDAVIHVIGDGLGALPSEESVKELLARYEDLAAMVEPTHGRAATLLGFSYTQWEAYLARYHGRRLHIYRPDQNAQRDPGFVLCPDQQVSQSTHLGRVGNWGLDHDTFSSPEDLSVKVMADLRDLLFEPRIRLLVIALGVLAGLIGGGLLSVPLAVVTQTIVASMAELVLIMSCGAVVARVVLPARRGTAVQRGFLYALIVLAAIAVTAKAFVFRQIHDQDNDELVNFGRSADVEYAFIRPAKLPANGVAGRRDDDERPPVSRVQADFAWYLYHDHHYEQSLERLKQIRDVPLSEVAALRNNLAILHAKLGDSTRAHEEFEAALRKSPENATIRWNYGLFLIRAGNHDLARAAEMLRARPQEAP
jgi:tetratricopeptide (TPR) repeat protein